MIWSLCLVRMVCHPCFPLWCANDDGAGNSDCSSSSVIFLPVMVRSATTSTPTRTPTSTCMGPPPPATDRAADPLPSCVAALDQPSTASCRNKWVLGILHDPPTHKNNNTGSIGTIWPNSHYHLEWKVKVHIPAHYAGGRSHTQRPCVSTYGGKSVIQTAFRRRLKQRGGINVMLAAVNGGDFKLPPSPQPPQWRVNHANKHRRRRQQQEPR
ncbi:hypothetical protein PHYSODRAFT_307218 [Phytophthora sojae]|uniref:Secreted protein n=1 Tax=Phytophthora sojae (strain P6497) TaxID=1094619 RepID=G5ADE2_PHYSP|nr:hypothetical protein PHYSODRAFT_307218 [Phytophthora sojae]EGZ06195.1 hypothetical protein PHYSODRAFT_307218 [Phytophthora sojae]|eukprot:XP_009538092.1 hypothetical protein PHYSODRAFT_307218 [Phytophthora sojae]